MGLTATAVCKSIATSSGSDVASGVAKGRPGQAIIHPTFVPYLLDRLIYSYRTVKYFNKAVRCPAKLHVSSVLLRISPDVAN